MPVWKMFWTSSMLFNIQYILTWTLAWAKKILELDFVLREAVARWSWEPTNLFLHILRPINDGLKTHPKVVNA